VSATKAVAVVNRLIGGLSQKDRNGFLRRSATVELSFGQILCEPQERIRYAYFPLIGSIALVATLGKHQPLEMGLIGNEGMLGATLVLGVDVAPLRAVVQGKGTALRLSATHLRRQLRVSPSLVTSLYRYQYVLMEQLAKSAACAHFHEVGARLARWLLMTHDRAHADHFHLTHEYLAGVLGVRRSGVTVAAGTLQRKMLIRYTRGKISILDREGLEAACCECYDAAIDDYRRLLPRPPTRARTVR
jgi:CRP-like cAMP-binding protein